MDLEEVTTAELRRVLELAHMVARSEQRRSSPPQPPAALAPALTTARLAPAFFELVRAAVAANDDFRLRVAELADEREVGVVGWLWVTRPPGWEADITHNGAALAPELTIKVTALEFEVARLSGELDDVRREATSLRARLDQATDLLAVERQAVADLAELVDAAEADADDRRRRAVELERRAVRAEAQLGAERTAHRDTRRELDKLIAVAVGDSTEATAAGGPSADPAAEAPKPSTSARPRRRPRRRPYRSARGVLDDSPAGLDELVKVPGVRVLVDGYNVAKTRWPEGTLEWQRERLLSSMAAKFTGQASPDVVFDGADTYSSTLYSSAARRSKVRVTWSPAGVTADDVLLAMVDRIDPGVTVVVVSTDREVAEGAADRGANVVSSWSFANWLP